MILIITNSTDETINYYESKCLKPIFRLNTDLLISSYKWFFSEQGFSIKNIKNGNLITNNELIGIYYRRPKNPIIEFKGFSNELIDELSIESRILYESFISSLETKWLSEPYSIRKSENRILQLEHCKKIGLKVPKYYIGNDSNKIESKIKESEQYCIKPISLGPFQDNNETFVPYTAIIKEKSDYQLMDNFPCLIQEYIPKKFEYRLTIIGDKSFCIKIDSQKREQTRIDWRKENCMAVDYSLSDIPNTIMEKCRQLLKSFNISYSAIDLIEDLQGDFYFLDLNPNGQWAWLDELLDLNMVKAFEDFFYERK